MSPNLRKLNSELHAIEQMPDGPLKEDMKKEVEEQISKLKQAEITPLKETKLEGKLEVPPTPRAENSSLFKVENFEDVQMRLEFSSAEDTPTVSPSNAIGATAAKGKRVKRKRTKELPSDGEEESEKLWTHEAQPRSDDERTEIIASPVKPKKRKRNPPLPRIQELEDILKMCDSNTVAHWECSFTFTTPQGHKFNLTASKE